MRHVVIFKNKLKTYWFKISDKIRFLIIGGVNASISFLIFSIFCILLGEDKYQLALILAWISSSIISFTTHRCFVFNIEGNLLKQYCKCCTTWVFSYMINATLLEFFVKKIGLNVYLAQIFATLTCAIFTYTMFKTFAFRRKK